MKGENGLRLLFTKKGFSVFENAYNEILMDYNKIEQKGITNILELNVIKKETENFVYIGWDFLRKRYELPLIKLALDVVREEGYGYRQVGFGAEYDDIEIKEQKSRKSTQEDIPKIVVNMEVNDEETYQFMMAEEIYLLKNFSEEMEC